MNITTWYVCYQPPQIRDPRMWFGHIRMAGRTEDNTWFFMNPSFDGFDFDIVHRHDEVTDRLHITFHGNLVFKLESVKPIRFHLMPIMNCATICAYLIGYRAFTPWGLKRKLLRNNVEVKFDGRITQ